MSVQKRVQLKLHEEYDAGEESSTLFSNSKNESMVELDPQRSVTKTLVIKCY